MRAFLAGRQSYLIAFALAAGLTVWMLSGADTSDAAPAPAEKAAAPERVKRFTVRTRRLEAAAVNREVVLRGRTEPAREVSLRAEIDARVVETGARRGSAVRAGDVIVRLDTRDREARLREARAAVKQHALRHAAYEKLEKTSYQSATALAEAEASLEAARALVRRVEVELANAVIRAPFDGVLDERDVEVGDYVSAGDRAGRVLEQDPILVTGHVTQHELRDLAVGDHAIAKLVTGETIEGRIRYLAAKSDEATRTFAVEVESPNPGRRIAAGITAEIRIPTETLAGHLISPALLSLGPHDAVGVKTVDGEGVVRFLAVDIVRSEGGGLWVSGLPASVDVITVGQGFVRDGEHVEAVPEEGG